MKILLLGANGQVGWELQRSLASIGTVLACDRSRANLEDLKGLKRLVHEERPNVIVNAAAYTAVDKAEDDQDKAKLINTDAVALLAVEAKLLGAWFVHYSTDYVYDAKHTANLSESEPVSPINFYGQSKWQGDLAIIESGCSHLIFRTSWVYSDRGDNFISKILALAASRNELSVVDDQVGAPTHARLIADVTAHALNRIRQLNYSGQNDVHGIYHLSASGETTWHDYARQVMALSESYGKLLKVKPSQVKAVTSEAFPSIARRPKNSRLDCSRLERDTGLCMPDWRYQMNMTVKELVGRELGH